MAIATALDMKFYVVFIAAQLLKVFRHHINQKQPIKTSEQKLQERTLQLNIGSQCVFCFPHTVCRTGLTSVTQPLTSCTSVIPVNTFNTVSYVDINLNSVSLPVNRTFKPIITKANSISNKCVCVCVKSNIAILILNITT